MTDVRAGTTTARATTASTCQELPASALRELAAASTAWRSPFAAAVTTSRVAPPSTTA